MSLVSDRSAFDLHGHAGTPMRKVSEYELNAQACLKLAASISDPEHKTTLLHMADRQSRGKSCRFVELANTKIEKRERNPLADPHRQRHRKGGCCAGGVSPKSPLPGLNFGPRAQRCAPDFSIFHFPKLQNSKSGRGSVSIFSRIKKSS